MSIDTEVTVTLARVEVADDYSVALTVHDLASHADALVGLSWSQAEQLADELREAAAEAAEALRSDRPVIVAHGFDLADTTFTMAHADDDCCGVLQDGYVCTRSQAHTGAHAAHINSSQVVATWEQS